MPYRISRADIENIAEALPETYSLDDTGQTLQLVKQDIDKPSTRPVAIAINEDHIEEYRKARREQLLREILEVQSFKTSVHKRVLCAIVNDAIRSIHS